MTGQEALWIASAVSLALGGIAATAAFGIASRPSGGLCRWVLIAVTLVFVSWRADGTPADIAIALAFGAGVWAASGLLAAPAWATSPSEPSVLYPLASHGRITPSRESAQSINDLTQTWLADSADAVKRDESALVNLVVLAGALLGLSAPLWIALGASRSGLGAGWEPWLQMSAVVGGMVLFARIVQLWRTAVVLAPPPILSTRPDDLSGLTTPVDEVRLAQRLLDERLLALAINQQASDARREAGALARRLTYVLVLSLTVEALAIIAAK